MRRGPSTRSLTGQRRRIRAKSRTAGNGPTGSATHPRLGQEAVDSSPGQQPGQTPPERRPAQIGAVSVIERQIRQPDERRTTGICAGCGAERDAVASDAPPVHGFLSVIVGELGAAKMKRRRSDHADTRKHMRLSLRSARRSRTTCTCSARFWYVRGRHPTLLFALSIPYGPSGTCERVNGTIKLPTETPGDGIRQASIGQVL
jgi:hypothetical protein